MQRSVEDYLEDIARLFEGSGGVYREDPVVDVSYDRNAGTLEAVIEFFPGGNRLVVFLEVEEKEEYIAWRRYRFQALDPEDRNIIRYDNSPHYPNLASFPEHRHVGSAEQPEPASAPSIRFLLEEISSLQPGE